MWEKERTEESRCTSREHSFPYYRRLFWLHWERALKTSKKQIPLSVNRKNKTQGADDHTESIHMRSKNKQNQIFLSLKRKHEMQGAREHSFPYYRRRLVSCFLVSLREGSFFCLFSEPLCMDSVIVTGGKMSLFMHLGALAWRPEGSAAT